ncbi:MAG: hypothetical protein ACFBSG_14640 [Leptolyngbyaceae cyanobacterium]
MNDFRQGDRNRWRATVGLWLLIVASSPGLVSCRQEAAAAPRTIAVEQTWEVGLGSVIEGFQVVAGLGDVSMHLRGASIRAPFDGEVQLASGGQACILFASPEVPAYLFRYCGINRPNLGAVDAGEPMGRAAYLHFATLRRQPEGTWAIVEPSAHVLERSLERY